MKNRVFDSLAYFSSLTRPCKATISTPSHNNHQWGPDLRALQSIALLASIDLMQDHDLTVSHSKHFTTTGHSSGRHNALGSRTENLGDPMCIPCVHASRGRNNQSIRGRERERALTLKHRLVEAQRFAT